MKIQDSNLTGLGGTGGAGRANGPNQTDGSARTRGGSGGRTERNDDGDSIQLSNLSQELSAEDTPERLAQVEQLRGDVRSGRYQPDALEVSKAIVSDALGSAAPTSGGGDA